MEEQAIVVETAKGVAWVEKARQTQCGGCRLRNGCGSAVLAKVLGARRNRIQVIDPLSVGVGDTVEIQLSSVALIRGSFVVYMMPLLGFFLGAILGKYVLSPILGGYAEALSTVFALLGLLLSVWFLRQFSRRIESDKRYHPVISNIVETNGEAAMAVYPS